MAHEIETMVYAGALPWHGLGTKVEANLTPAEIQTAAGLDWTVSKRILAYQGSLTYMEEPVLTKGCLLDIPERFALVRDSDNQFLDIVGKTYHPTQNKDAFEFFDAFVKETKLKMHTAGSLCQGKYVWALAETDKSFEIGPGKDKVESYILLVSPHQFGKALIAQQTTVRVVCANTLALALNEKGVVSYRMPHSRKFDQKNKEAAGIVLGLATQAFSLFKNQVEALAEKKIKRVDAVDFYKELLRLTDDQMDTANDNGLPKSRNLRQFMEAFEGASPGADLAGSKGTLWGAVNAVTYVMDHVSVRNKEIAFRDNLFGYRGDLKRKALNLALKIAA